jgi:hypothetical protein
MVGGIRIINTYIRESYQQSLRTWEQSKVKSSPLQALEALRVVRLRLPHFLDNRLTDGKVVSPTRRPLFTSQEDSWYSFLLEAESTPRAIVWLEGLKKSTLSGIWTGDLPVCSIVPQPTTLPPAPHENKSTAYYLKSCYEMQSVGPKIKYFKVCCHPKQILREKCLYLFWGNLFRYPGNCLLDTWYSDLNPPTLWPVRCCF